MPNLKDIKRRIGSVKKTKQITSAMKLVAGAKLKRATEAALNARPYQEKLGATLANVVASAGQDASDPLLETRDEVHRVHVVILTTDRGLCGPFNNTLLRKIDGWLHDKSDAGVEVHVRVYGRKADQFLAARGHEVHDSVLGYAKTPKMDLVRPLTDDAVARFVDGQADEVWLVYNEFVNNLVQRPRLLRLLPLGLEAADDQSTAVGGDFRYEPTAPEVLEALLPLYLRTIVLQAFLETEAGEYAARMTAMDSATRNASELIDKLTLLYNRARQAAITTEIIEIVSGAEAL